MDKILRDRLKIQKKELEDSLVYLQDQIRKCRNWREEQVLRSMVTRCYKKLSNIESRLESLQNI